VSKLKNTQDRCFFLKSKVLDNHNVYGFTLIEVIVATLILSIGITGIIGIFNTSIRATARGDRIGVATSIARQTLEPSVAVSADKCLPQEGNVGQFKWNLSYSQKPHGLMKATVVVKWLDKGQPEAFELSQIFLPRQES